MAGPAAFCAPTITQQPSSVTTAYDSSVSFSVSATGTGQLTYQWNFNGVPLAGETSWNLGYYEAQPAEAGKYTVTVTDSTGSVTSSAATLTLTPDQPLPSPTSIGRVIIATTGSTVSVNDYYNSGNDFASVWYKDGQVATESSLTYNNEVTDPGTYVQVIGNSAGSVSQPSQAAYFFPSTPSNVWLAASSNGSVVYFAFSNPAQIQRYDMAAGAWLPPVNLPQAPTAIEALPEGVYVAFGRTTYLYSLDLSTSQQLANTLYSVFGIFSNSTYAYLEGASTDGSSEGLFVAINRATLQQAASTTLSSDTAYTGMVASAATGLAYGWQVWEPTGLSAITLNADGSVTANNQFSRQVEAAEFDESQLFASPDGSRILVDGGGIYAAANLAPLTSFGLPVIDICFLSDGSPVGLRGSSLDLLDPTTYQEVGTLPLASNAYRIFANGTTVYAFSAPSTPGGAIAVASVPKAQLAASARAPLAGLSASQSAAVSFAPDLVFVGNDGNVYMLERALAQILRWSPSQGGYLSSIALEGSPFGASYSTELNRIYVWYGDRRITKIDLSSSTTEAPFFICGSNIDTALAVGNYLYVAYSDMGDSGNQEMLVDHSGTVVAQNGDVYPSYFPAWNDAKGLMYELGTGISSQNLSAGTFVSAASTAYPPAANTYALPLEFSADGTLLVDGDGVILDAVALTQTAVLGVAPTDACWIGSNVYTIAPAAAGGTTLTLWKAPGYLSAGATSLPGEPVRVIALSGSQILAVTDQPTGPVLTVLDASGTVLSQKSNAGQAFEEPLITTEPADATFAGGATATLGLGLAGSGFTYSWYQGGTLVSTSPTLSFPDVSELDAGLYYVNVSAYGQTVESTPAALYVQQAPVFTTQPVGATVSEYYPISMIVSAASYPAATYQWYLNGSAITGATSLYYGGYSPGTAGQYSYTCVASNPYGSTTSNVATLTVLAAPAPPQITQQPSSASVFQGAQVVFAAAASGSPDPTYQWYFNNGPISGATSSTYTIASATQASAGSYYVIATNSQGSAQSSTATLSVSSVATTAISTPPASLSVQTGSNVSFSVSATGSGTLTYQWAYNGNAISGATASSYTISNAQPSQSGNYTVNVTGQGGTTTAGAVLAVSNATGAPSLQSQPQSQTIQAGSTVVFYVGSNGTVTTGTSIRAASSTTYQWYFDGIAISGATDATLVVSGATSANAGTYTCLITNSSGSTLSSSANLSIAHSTNPGHLTDVSCRSQVGTGANILIAGFAVGGQGTSGTLPVLIRSSGPALSGFGITGYLPDPTLELFNSSSSSTPAATNSGWKGSATVTASASAVGAFAWTSSSSLDSALVENLTTGPYTAQTLGASNDTGVALAEVYDATPSGSYVPGVSPRLVNLSARIQVGTGSNQLIAGFVIGGSTAQTVLIRASGPALSSFGLSGVLADPQLQLYQTGSSNTLLATRTAWGGDSQIAAAAASVGAFAWNNASSNDAAILVTLPPGSYTANVSGASGDTGIALVEVYEVP